MSLPKLTEVEYQEMKEELIETYQDFMWFLEISGYFFDNMYGNIYQEYIEYVEKEEKEDE